MSEFAYRYLNESDEYEISIYNINIGFLTIPEPIFSIIESSFVKPNPTISQITYQSNLLHQVTYFDGSYEELSLTNTEYDNYISNISNYKIDYENYLSTQDTTTLEQEKINLIELIKFRIKELIDNIIPTSSSFENKEWFDTFLPEALAYDITETNTDAPNLVEQQLVILDDPLIDQNGTVFKTALGARVDQIVIDYQNYLAEMNFYIGKREYWVNYINNFTQGGGETEQEAIDRLKAIDWESTLVYTP